MRLLLLINCMLLTGAVAAQTLKETTIDDMFQDTVMKSIGWLDINEKIPDSILAKYHMRQYDLRTSSCYMPRDPFYKQNDPYGFVRKKAVVLRKSKSGKKQVSK